MDDWDLLEQFRLTRSEQAFGELVRRHAGFVLAICRRRLCDPHLAEDAAQAVFLALARRPPTRSGSSALAGWLYRTAGYACNNAMRAKNSRNRHERRAAAAQLAAANASPGSRAAASPMDRAETEALLDRALAELSSKERDAVLLRYYQDQSVQRVGQSLGISQNSATKRITRAIDRMREFLAGHGLAISAPTLIEAVTQATRAPAPSAEFIARAISVATGQSVASVIVQHLAEGLDHMIRIAQIKLIATVATVVVGVCGLITVNQVFARPADPKPATAPAGATTQPAPANTPKQALKDFAAAVRRGDAAHLRELATVDTDDEKELIGAACAYVGATRTFSHAVTDRFGAEAKKEFSSLFELTPIGRFGLWIETTADNAAESIDGRVAMIQPPEADDLTFWLVDVDGQWKLSTHRMIEKWTPDEFHDRVGLMTTAAEALDQCTQDVASGKYATLAELKRVLAPILRQNR